MSKYFCNGNVDVLDPQRLSGNISAIAELALESHIVCDAEGKYAYGCGTTWASAKSYAGAAYELFASAWADVGGGCDCATEIYASADAVVRRPRPPCTQGSHGLQSRPARLQCSAAASS